MHSLTLTVASPVPHCSYNFAPLYLPQHNAIDKTRYNRATEVLALLWRSESAKDHYCVLPVLIRPFLANLIITPNRQPPGNFGYRRPRDTRRHSLWSQYFYECNGRLRSTPTHLLQDSSVISRTANKTCTHFWHIYTTSTNVETS